MGTRPTVAAGRPDLAAEPTKEILMRDDTNPIQDDTDPIQDDTNPIQDYARADRPTRRGTRTGLKVALISAGVAAGAIGATAIGASASTTSGSGSTTSGYAQSAASGAPSGTDAHAGQQAGPGGANPVRSDEKSVSSSVAATLKAAALQAVPGGTVVRVETDAGDGVYEAHMKKADGSLVTVKFDKNLKVTAVEDGMGK